MSLERGREAPCVPTLGKSAFARNRYRLPRAAARALAHGSRMHHRFGGIYRRLGGPWRRCKRLLRTPESPSVRGHPIVRIAVIGTGYVGLVSGACFADFGHVVTCVDKDAGKIGALRNGVIPIFEPGLDDLVAKNTQQARLFFETDAAPAVRSADAVFIAVGTPSRRGDGHADLSYVYEAAREIARELDGYTVVITKSTVPIGTGDEIERIIREVRPDADVSVVSNPEFLREGAAIEDFKHPDRIVVGTRSWQALTVRAM